MLSPRRLPRLAIAHAKTPSSYIPYIFSHHTVHTWTWLKPDSYRGTRGSLSFNWPLWDQIAGCVSNTNGHRMPLTSPSVGRGLWWQPVRINSPRQATVQFIRGSRLQREAFLTTRLRRPIKAVGRVIAESQMFKYHQNCLKL